MEEELVVNEIKDEDVIADEHIVEYDVSEIGNVLAEIRGIENAIDRLKDCISSIDKLQDIRQT